MSLFEGLNVATRGLSAAQLGINVTGQNITNAGTEGYSRKRIEQAAAWKKDGSYGQMGFGVEIYSINRIRDEFVDRMVNQESTRYGYDAMKAAVFTRIEDVFGEQQEHNALNAILNAFWDGWSDLAKDPESQGAREALRTNAQMLTGHLNYLATKLREDKEMINDQIEARVIKINQITEGIYRCNMTIAAAEASLGNKANDTRDQRDALLNELAQLVDVEYHEDDLGILTVSSNGNLLVSPAKSHELIVNRNIMTQQDGYQYSRVEITYSTTRREFAPRSGEIKALLEARDVDIPEYQNYIDQIAQTLITEVNKIHQGGYGLSLTAVGLTFLDFFDSDPAKFSAANISIAPTIKENLSNIAAGLGGVIQEARELRFTPTLDYAYNATVVPGDPYRSMPLDLPLFDHKFDYEEFYRFDNVSNPDSTNYNPAHPDYRPEYDSGNALYDPVLPSFDTANSAYRYLQKGTLEIYVIDPNTDPADPLNNKRTLIEGQDYTIDYTNARIVFMNTTTSFILGDPADPNSAPMEMVISFKYHENGYSGPGDGQNAQLLSDLRDKPLMLSDNFGENTQTINQFYAGALGRLGTEKNDAEVGLETRTYALAQLRTRQDEIMGVELDEEMASLIKYQHSYSASARYLTTINTMLETLLNM